MKVITLLNEKGGVGKTTLSTNLAAYLALQGHRVLFLDTEQQKNAASAFGFKPEPGFYDLMVRKAAWSNVLRRVPATVLGATDNIQGLYTVLGNHETRFVSAVGQIQTLILQRLLEIEAHFDFCIVDSSPTLGELHKGILLATNYILIPTDLEPFSALDGVPDTNAHAGNMRQIAEKANLDTSKVLGIIPNRFRSQTSLHSTFLKLLKEQYGDLVWTPIPLAIAIPESQLAQEFLFKVAPDLKITKSLVRFGERVLREIGNQADMATA